ncbi:multidrug transporter EmrE-like cation transporter [Fusobacterium sp. PH5-7]|uniref:DMT family transporter n=1 Tax=Fusobacterium sp. PH5-7 TaxID=2940528 RepID=UPI0024734DEA|nr:DMT family transporter [Fusobacterium sp. PH5-7]MDH6459290.1 multidrug transporter EmrE-like cation transporter [Fusobacterium sp. PH5-7]
MLYLIIAVLSNTFMTFIIRLSEKEKSNRFNVNTFNYLFGGILAYFVIRKESIFSFDGDYKYTLFLAMINAVLYITCLYLMQVNMKKNGAPLTTTYNRLGLLIPILVSVILFKEYPNQMQIIGCILAIFSIYYINKKDKKDEKSKVSPLLLIALFMAGGMVDTLAKIYGYYGNSNLQGHFIFYTFVFSFIFSLILSIKSIKNLSKKEILIGFFIGIPNQITTLAQLKAVAVLPAYLVFPAYSISVILLVNLVNFLFFKEKLTMRQYVGTGIIISALICMNV